MLNHNLLFSVPCCFLLDRLIKETTCNVMVDHLESRVTPWRQYASHVKVRGTLLKIDVCQLNFRLSDSSSDKFSSKKRATDGLSVYTLSSSRSTNNQTKKIMTHTSSVAHFYTRRTKRQRTNQVLLVRLNK